MTTSPELPVGQIAARYGDLRTLRTRATGTPFRAVWRSGQLIVIPTSGNERVITVSELRDAWPLIAGGATRTVIKRVSNNSSYIDAIYDDMQLESTASGVLRSEPGNPPSAAIDVTGIEAQAEELRSRLNEAIDRLDRYEHENRKWKGTTADLEATIADLRSELSDTTTGRGQFAERLAEATKHIAELEAKVKKTGYELVLQFDGRRFSSKRKVVPNLWQLLSEAAKLAFPYPSASVAASRRALESAIASLWREAGDPDRDPEKVADMLAELRGHRLMPDPDWHLAKNLYGRASAIVHEGTDRPDLALWIFFGTVQICELVQPRSA